MAEHSDRSNVAAIEFALRLADAYAILQAVEYDDDGEPIGHMGGELSAIDHALHGSSGCMEQEEWDALRLAALIKHGPALKIGLEAVEWSSH